MAGAFRWSPGCQCCGTCKPMTLTAVGCKGLGGQGQPLPNAPYTITDAATGDVIASGDTDAAGKFTLNGTGGTAYTCTIAAKRFNKFVQGFTFVCGGTRTFDVCGVAKPAAGFACCANWPYPTKTVLSYSDKKGAGALVFQGTDPCSGGWQLCRNVQSTVAGDAGCHGADGQTPTLVGFCPGISMTWANWGCPPIDPIGQYEGCVNAAVGVAFTPISTAGCVPATEPTTLSCDTFNVWGNTCVSFGSLIFGNRGTQVALAQGVAYAVVPPAGLLATGTWGLGSCPPVVGGFTISE